VEHDFAVREMMMFDSKRETYEQYLARWEAEADEHAPNPFEVAEYFQGKPYPPEEPPTDRLVDDNH
jgi:hypothetical protein